METLEQLSATLALTMGVAWASGINLYATVLTLGLLATNDAISLPPELQIVADPLVIAAAGLMYAIEFFADKVPGVDSAWDALHTFIRIPAGAMLAASAVGDINPAVELAAAIAGGAMAGGSHFAKAGTRLLVNTSPEPFSNWLASIGEDVAVVAGVWACLQHPWWFLAALLLFVLLLVKLFPLLVQAARKIVLKLTAMRQGRTQQS